ALVRLQYLAERAQLGRNRGPVLLLLGGERERRFHALDAGGAAHFAVVRLAFARRGGNRHGAGLVRDRTDRVARGGERHRRSRGARARQRHIDRLLGGDLGDAIVAIDHRDGLDLDRREIGRRRSGGGKGVGGGLPGGFRG